MAAVRLNQRNSYSIPLPQGELLLFPGVNLAVPDDMVEAMKAHPIVKILIEQDTIEILTKTKEPTSDIEGIPVVDGKDEPLPVLPVADRSAAKQRKSKPVS